MVKIKLPPEGYLARDLVISELLLLLDTSPSIENDFAIAEDEIGNKLREGIENMRKNKVLISSLGKFKRNYAAVYNYIVNEDLNNIINDFVSDKEEYFEPFSLFFPELLEAERWYGGWNASSKGSKKSVQMSKKTALLAALALDSFTVFTYIVKRSRTDVDYYFGIAPVDTEIQFQLCSNLITEKRINISKLDKLSHLGRIFLFSMYYSDNVCQKLIMLTVRGNRAEIIEENTYSSIAPFVEIWKHINSENPKYREKLKNILNLNDKYSPTDVFNRISNYVFQAVSGAITPEEMAYFIAKDTYLKDDVFGFITPKMVRTIKEAVILERQKQKGGYSA
ncbi:hypothetical protein STK_00310 [Sulfurisphaera tokodaii str. 7]|uniref:CRISPR-associated protein n=1 Tax=Sulfurisphaera tokodaii (strain DSM 16993 / JCM 10545 / NBRC 100140 / 7) TaxID=273063 RepID=Q977B2_SULTO|nr:hypothetical protein [Sulfurisphaera tokodaii]BAB64982.1 hypothetical protein STK_00310 [Sulfurisphaera tokodaii str. 7]